MQLLSLTTLIVALASVSTVAGKNVQYCQANARTCGTASNIKQGKCYSSANAQPILHIDKGLSCNIWAWKNCPSTTPSTLAPAEVKGVTGTYNGATDKRGIKNGVRTIGSFKCNFGL